MSPRFIKHWQLRDPITPEADQALSDFPPFFRQILFGRGIHDAQQADTYLHGAIAGDPFLLSQMRETADRLLWAADHGEPVAVYGDYDVDGVTATALLSEVLRRYGANVRPYIPNRFDEGYGLNSEAVAALANEGVKVIITVDCGIRSPREAELANELDVDLIISDHHHPGEELPDAYAVICPKREADPYPEKDLSGVGLAYKIAQALGVCRPQAGVCADDWLDLVALGTVADMVPLRGENRSLVRRGLSLMRSRPRPGLVSLMGVAGVKRERLTAGDIGFMLGPRLNAAGRLETALKSLELLLAQDVMECGFIAQQLDDGNRKRQNLTRETQERAEAQVAARGIKNILFAFDASFNSGVVGLAASRLVDVHYRPAIVGEQGPEFTRASCRSIPEFHITNALDACSDLLVRHGGHALAAGFTIPNQNLPAFIERMTGLAEDALSSLNLTPVIYADLDIPLSEIKPDSVLPRLEMLQPTGQHNPEVLFISRNLKVVRASTVGAEKQHLRFSVTDGQWTYDAIAFRQGHWLAEMPGVIDLLYVLEINEYNGRKSLQLNVRDLRPAEA